MIRGVRAAKAGPSWQDLRAVYSQTAVCRAFRMHGAHILPKPAHFGCVARESCRELAVFPPEAAFGMHGAQNLPRIAARERTAAKSCHGKTPRTYRARILPLPVRPRAHQGAILPPSDAGKRISRAFCHRRAPGNASRHNLATTGRPRRTPRATMCYGSRLAHGRGSERPPFAYATRHPDAAGLRVLQVVRALAVAQPADCRVAAERVVNIAKLVSVPQRRSATTPCATIPCAAAPQRHALQHHDAMHRTRRFCRR